MQKPTQYCKAIILQLKRIIKLLCKHSRKCIALLREKKINPTVKYVFTAMPRRSTFMKTGKKKKKKKPLKSSQNSLATEFDLCSE